MAVATAKAIAAVIVIIVLALLAYGMYSLIMAMQDTPKPGEGEGTVSFALSGPENVAEQGGVVVRDECPGEVVLFRLRLFSFPLPPKPSKRSTPGFKSLSPNKVSHVNSLVKLLSVAVHCNSFMLKKCLHIRQRHHRSIHSGRGLHPYLLIRRLF